MEVRGTRGWEYGDNRSTVGVHFPSDIEAGRISAAAMVAVMMTNPAFETDSPQLRKAPERTP